MKNILRNLWNHRSQNIWLFVELIIVTVVAWMVLDTAIVCRYLRNMPDGFDADRLVCIKAHSVYNPLKKDNIDELKDYLRQIDDVENVCIEYSKPYGSFTTYQQGIENVAVDNDTVWVRSFKLYPGQKFFNTYGIHVLDGCVAEDDWNPEVERTIVISKSIAQRMFNRTDVAGRRIHILTDDRLQYGDTKEWIEYRIQAVVEDSKASTYDYNPCALFIPTKFYGGENNNITLRLKEGVDPRLFLEVHRQELNKAEVNGGRYSLFGGQPYQTIREAHNAKEKEEKEYRMNLLLSSFFLISVCLGTIGAFWKQMQRRTGEVGIMRAFGATRPRVMRMFLQEGFVLTTLAVFIGIAIYFNYAISHEFPSSYLIPKYNPGGMFAGIPQFWFMNFSTHFTVVSVLIYLLLLTVVSIGIAIPAWRASRTHIVDTLK